MAVFQGDLIQLIDNQEYLGQQILNVYYYRFIPLTSIGDGGLSLFNDSWEDTVLTALLPLQVAGLTHVSREWKNLTNGVDLFVDGSVVSGTRAGGGAEWAPSFVSAGFILRRESLVTRNGYKRIAGLNSNDISGNNYVGSPTFITNIEIALAADLNVGIIPSLEPVIVKRPIVPPVVSYAYSSIGSSSFRSVGTQNTRKAGRGI